MIDAKTYQNAGKTVRHLGKDEHPLVTGFIAAGDERILKALELRNEARREECTNRFLEEFGIA